MILRIEINLGNSAFGNDPYRDSKPEVIRILGIIRGELPGIYEDLWHGAKPKLWDANGDCAGFVSLDGDFHNA